MSRLPIELHPQAIEEARAVRSWYAKRSPEASQSFLDELDLAIDRIGETPDRYAKYLSGTRRYLLRRFPYLIVYRLSSDRILIVAIAHGRRRPGYWRNRK